MSWLGLNGSSRDDFQSLSDAYAKMYAPQTEGDVELGDVEEPQELKEGKKDACYNKVKSRYSVWPSAYASGALVKCRQKGAKNWGNSSKKEAFEASVDEMIAEGEVDLGEVTREDAWDAFLFGWDEALQEGKDPVKQALESDKKLMKLHTKDKPAPKGYVKEEDILKALEDTYAMMYEKKKDSDKCGDDTYWDKEEKKCKSKKKKSGTTVVVGRGGIYGPGYHGGGGGSNGGGDGETDGGDGGDGGDAGGGGE